MRNFGIITIIALCISNVIFIVKWKQEQAARQIATVAAEGLAPVKSLYRQAESFTRQSEQKFVAVSDSTFRAQTKWFALWRKKIGKPQPGPAAQAIRFDTIYIPIETPASLATLFADSSECADEVQFATQKIEAYIREPRQFSFSDEMTGLTMRGTAGLYTGVRVDTLNVRTALVLHEETRPAPGLARILYRERILHPELLTPLVTLSPKEHYLAREPNKFNRFLQKTGVFLAGAATGYAVNQFLPNP